jgi:hypothetical protein
MRRVVVWSEVPFNDWRCTAIRIATIRTMSLLGLRATGAVDDAVVSPRSFDMHGSRARV